MTDRDPSHLDDAALDQRLAEAIEVERRELKHHPSPDELLAFERRALDAADRDRLEDHLAVCSVCVQAVLDYAAFPNLDEHVEAAEPPRAVEKKLAAEWRRLKQEAKRERSGQRGRTEIGLAHSRLAWGLAGLFFVLLLSLAWILLVEIPEPRVDIAFAVLAPEGDSDERGEPRTVPLAPWADGLYLLLPLGDLEDFAAYRLELLDADGGSLWSTREVRRSSDGSFRIEIPRALLKNGSYRLELYGADTRGDTRLATYRFEVELAGTR